MKFARFVGGVAVAAALAVNAGSASAQKEYVYGQWLPPKHNVNLFGLEPMLDNLSKAGLPWKLVAGGQLFNAQTTLKSVGNRTAEAGLIVPSYTRTSLRNAFIVADMMMMGENELIMNAAAHETYFFDCPECMDDYKKNGTVYLAGYGVGGYSLLCREAISGLDDLKGLKLRTTGALGRWARALGGTPVSMSMSDVPEAIKRGQIDCIVGPLAWIKSYPIEDSIKTVWNYNFGSYSGLGLFVMNRAAWDAYSDDQKRKFWSEVPGAVARTVVEGYMGDDLRSRVMAKKLNIKIMPANDAIKSLWVEHKKTELKTVIANAKKLKVKNPEKIVDAYQKYIAKWTKIITDAGLLHTIAAANPDQGELKPATAKYEELLREHIFSKIDPTKL
jgi:TRAP-type C4-dicarboxylate transport system substrate-binding protein